MDCPLTTLVSLPLFGRDLRVLFTRHCAHVIVAFLMTVLVMNCSDLFFSLYKKKIIDSNTNETIIKYILNIRLVYFLLFISVLFNLITICSVHLFLKYFVFIARHEIFLPLGFKQPEKVMEGINPLGTINFRLTWSFSLKNAHEICAFQPK